MGIETTELGELVSWYPKSWVNWYLTFGHRSCIEIIATWKIREIQGEIHGKIQAPQADPHSPHSMWVHGKPGMDSSRTPGSPCGPWELPRSNVFCWQMLQWHVYYIVIDSCKITVQSCVILYGSEYLLKWCGDHINVGGQGPSRVIIFGIHWGYHIRL